MEQNKEGAMKGKAIIVTLLLFAISLWGCQGGGGGGGGGKNPSDDEDAIKAVVKEVIEGMIGDTEESYKDKVFPHISNDYNYAGFDKEGFENDMLEGLEEDQPEFSNYTIKQDVSIDGKKATDVAELSTDISAPSMEEQIGFAVSGQADLKFEFNLQKEKDGKWRVLTIKSRPSSFFMSGAKEGDEDALPEISNPAISPANEAAPEGSVTLTGNASLNTDKYSYFGLFGLDWYDFIPNLSSPTNDEDSMYFFDFSGTKGSFALNATLPDDGMPEGLKIPKTLSLGDDSIFADLAIIALDKPMNEGGVPVAGEFHFWTIPLKPFENKDLKTCENEPLNEQNHAGAWLMQIPVANTNLLLDLTFEDTSAIGWIGYIDHSQATPQRILFMAIGDLVDEDKAVIGFTSDEGCPPDDPRVIEYTLNFTGTTGNGTLSVSGCGEAPSEADLLLEKLSNRCEYLTNPEDIVGDDWTLVLPDSTEVPMEINGAPEGPDCYTVVLNGTDHFVMCHALNIGWTTPWTKDGTDLGFAFNDANSGVAVFSDYTTGNYLTTEFYR